MNYIIEDNFNFFNELNKEEDMDQSSGNKNEQVCMISHMPLTYNSVKLPCNHTFNYLPLYKELVLVNTHTPHKTIKCPYCRTMSMKLLPYIPLVGVEKRYGINIPKTLCMDGPKCVYSIKSGKHKGLECSKDGMEGPDGTFCKKHFEHIQVASEEQSKIKKPKPIIIWTNEKEDLFKRKTVAQLKEMLKKKRMKTTGLKKELVNRVFIYNAANSSSNTPTDLISLL
jgi:hypothetical protein